MLTPSLLHAHPPDLTFALICICALTCMHMSLACNLFLTQVVTYFCMQVPACPLALLRTYLHTLIFTLLCILCVATYPFALSCSDSHSYVCTHVLEDLCCGPSLTLSHAVCHICAVSQLGTRSLTCIQISSVKGLQFICFPNSEQQPVQHTDTQTIEKEMCATSHPFLA